MNDRIFRFDTLEDLDILMSFLDGRDAIPATLKYTNESRDVRIALSSYGELMTMAPRARKYGYKLDVWRLCYVVLHLPDEKTPAQEYADDVRRYKDYFERNSSSHLWQDIRNELAQVTDEKLKRLEAMDCTSHYEAWKTAGELGLPKIEQHKTTTLKNCGAPQHVIDGVRDAIKDTKEFMFAWVNDYDYTVNGKMCNDGVYRAWLSQEYRGYGNGHYWLLISPTQAIFAEDD